MAMPCGRLNCPGPSPGSPQENSSFPSAENLWTRALPYPSVMYRSPDGAIATLVGMLNGGPGRLIVR